MPVARAWAPLCWFSSAAMMATLLATSSFALQGDPFRLQFRNPAGLVETAGVGGGMRDAILAMAAWSKFADTGSMSTSTRLGFYRLSVVGPLKHTHTNGRLGGSSGRQFMLGSCRDDCNYIWFAPTPTPTPYATAPRPPLSSLPAPRLSIRHPRSRRRRYGFQLQSSRPHHSEDAGSRCSHGGRKSHPRTSLHSDLDTHPTAAQLRHARTGIQSVQLLPTPLEGQQYRTTSSGAAIYERTLSATSSDRCQQIISLISTRPWEAT